jgi:hypothetical protein
MVTVDSPGGHMCPICRSWLFNTSVAEANGSDERMDAVDILFIVCLGIATVVMVWSLWRTGVLVFGLLREETPLGQSG